MLRSLMALVYAAFHRPQTTIYRWTNGIVWTLILFSVGLFTAEITIGVDFKGSTFLTSVDVVLMVFFAVEITLRIASFRPPDVDIFRLSPAALVRVHLWGRVRYALTPLNLIDIITVLALIPELRGLRAFRLLRLARSPRFLGSSRPIARFVRGFYEHRLPFVLAFTLLGIQVIVGGVTVYLIEGASHPQIDSVADALWWALVTLTTVGYGDIVPLTELGRVVGGVMMVGGMFTLALFAGIVGHTFLNILISVREEAFMMTDYHQHIIVCGYTPAARSFLEQLSREFGPERQLLLMAEGERDPAISPDLDWVTGDPTHEPELKKVRLERASVVVVIANRAVPPQQADATTLMTLFTVRSHMKAARGSAPRRVPLRVVAEILEQENRGHAERAGADEVIVSNQLGYSVLAHAAAVPGSARVVTAMASAGDLNLYTGVAPVRAAGAAWSFVELAGVLKSGKDALLIGLRDTETGVERLNPPADTPVVPGDGLVYLAATPVLPLPLSGRHR